MSCKLSSTQSRRGTADRMGCMITGTIHCDIRKVETIAAVLDRTGRSRLNTTLSGSSLLMQCRTEKRLDAPSGRLFGASPSRRERILDRSWIIRSSLTESVFDVVRGVLAGMSSFSSCIIVARGILADLLNHARIMFVILRRCSRSCNCASRPMAKLTACAAGANKDSPAWRRSCVWRGGKGTEELIFANSRGGKAVRATLIDCSGVSATCGDGLRNVARPKGDGPALRKGLSLRAIVLFVETGSRLFWRCFCSSF
mmetsp:Transcript_565/g.1041  ORF Transcript_565/g.1041 Transcript_565/m.1041 type:complete len:256 (+) Transcript_565:261-1028(+)